MQTTRTHDTTNPRWWKDQHTSAWDRVKEALRRDWEQTKADLTRKRHGQELDQDVGDTVRQAVGKEPIPPTGAPTPESRDDWARVEPAVRYGYGARAHYTDHDAWDDRLEGRLRTDWDSMKTGNRWEDVKAHVRHGWDRARSRI